MSVVGELIRIENENDLDVEWKMNFLHLSENVGAYYVSPLFSFKGASWSIGMYPNGTHCSDSVEHIHLRLNRHSLGLPSTLEFSFAVKTLNGKKDLERPGTKYFKGWDYIDRLVPKSEFLRRKSEFLSFGFLTVVCTLKGSNSTSNTAKRECSYCKRTFDFQEIMSHEKMCTVKCPECSDVVLYQDWQNHECQTSKTDAATNTTDSYILHHHNKILQDLKQLFLKQENCDVVLRVKDQEFQAHKIILAARSPVFASTFRNNMKEKKTGIVEIEDCDPSIFTDFLSFLYSGDIDELSEDNVFDLFTASDKYDISDLRAKCLKFMKENLSVENFCETLSLALQHTETELISLATDFFIKNAKKIILTLKWQSFVSEYPTQSNELFLKFVASIGS